MSLNEKDSSILKSTAEVAAFDPMDVAADGRKGMLLMATSRLSAMLVGLVSSALMGRLLTPEDYGLVAMATTMMVLLNLLKDFGLTTSLVQSQTLSAKQLDAVFWLNLLIAACVAVIGACAASFIAAFFGYEAITDIVYVLCASLLIVSVSATHGAMLRRQLNFSALMWSEVVAQIAGLLVGVGLAWAYRSYWAIVASQVANAIASTLVLFAYLRWIPGRPKELSSARSLVRAGANISIFSLLNFFSNQLGAIVTGAYLGAAAAGHFNRAQQLLSLTGNTLMQPISQTVLPVLSRLQKSPEEYRAYYLTLLQRTSLFFGLLGAFVIVTGDAVALLLLGPKWDITGEMYRWFGLSIIAVGMASQTGNVLISQGRSAELRHWGFGDAFIRAGASGLGVLLGVVGVAAAFGMATLFVTVPIVGWIVSRKGPVQVAEQFLAMRSGALAAIATVIVGLGVRANYWPQGPAAAIALGASLALLSLGLIALVDSRTRQILVDAISAITQMANKKNSSGK